MVEREHAVFWFGVHQNGMCIVYLQAQAVLHVTRHLLIWRPYSHDNFNAVVAVDISKLIFVCGTKTSYLVDESMLLLCGVFELRASYLLAFTVIVGIKCNNTYETCLHLKINYVGATSKCRLY